MNLKRWCSGGQTDRSRSPRSLSLGSFLVAIVLGALGLAAVSPTARAGEIHDAIAAGDLPRVSALLAADRALASVPSESDPFRSTPLHLAAIGGHVEIARALLGAGAAVDAGDSDGSTPLDCAALNRHPEMVSFLLERGANPNRRDRNGAYPLSFAASAGDTISIERLLAAGSDLYFRPANGFTLLHYAAVRDLRGFARFLMNQGVRPDTADGQGLTPVHLCAERGRLAMLQLLIERGANVDRPAEGGWTPLMVAASGGQTETVRLLLAHGADARRAMHGTTMLHHAVMRGNADVVEQLLLAGADITRPDSTRGRTPLHWAALCGYGDIANLLVSRNAPVNAKDRDGRTPWTLATRYGHREIAEALRTAGTRGAREWSRIAPPDPLARDVPVGDAQVFYLGHSGWGVRTREHLLIFDYMPGPRPADDASLLSGCITAEQLAGRDVYVFASHAHSDHFSPAIFSWAQSQPGIHYILGFTPREQPVPCTILQPRETRQFGEIEVTAIRSNDSGVGFLVTLDGVTLFHAGDHANRERRVTEEYATELQFVKERAPRINLAFLPVSGCNFGDQEAVRIGVEYTLDLLQPDVFFPMHAGQGEDRLAAFVDNCRARHRDVRMQAVENRGDTFWFRDGRLASVEF